MFQRPLIAMSVVAVLGMAQTTAPDPVTAAALKVEPPASGEYTVTPGTKVALSLINSISTKHSAEGDRVYLETSFPVLASGKIVIPVGSYVAGTVTQIKKPGRVKGRG